MVSLGTVIGIKYLIQLMDTDKIRVVLMLKNYNWNTTVLSLWERIKKKCKDFEAIPISCYMCLRAEVDIDKVDTISLGRMELSILFQFMTHSDRVKKKCISFSDYTTYFNWISRPYLTGYPQFVEFCLSFGDTSQTCESKSLTGTFAK